MTTTAYDKAIDRLDLAVTNLDSLSDKLLTGSVDFMAQHADKAIKCSYLLKLAFIELNGLAMDTLSKATRRNFMMVCIKAGVDDVYNSENISDILELTAQIECDTDNALYDWGNKVGYWNRRLARA
jgi:hypothetical protein